MKVLHVLQKSLPSLTGYCIRADASMRALQTRGVQVVALTGAAEPSAEPQEHLSGVTYYRTNAHIPAGPLGYREWCLYRALKARLADVVDRERPDIIHVHSPAYNALASAAVARSRRKPLVYEIRATWEDAAVDSGRLKHDSLPYRAAARVETHVCRRADAVVTICDGLRREIASRGIGSSKIFVAPNGVEAERFTPVDRDENIAKTLGLDTFPVFAFVGSLFSYEGVEDLLDVAGDIVSRFSHARLLIVGGGEREREVQARVASLSLPQVMYRPRVPHGEVSRYYALADCLVYPRRRNRLTELVTPLKPLEALAMGKTVVASDVGGHRELIKDGVTGLLYRAGDRAALIGALSRIASDVGLAGRLAAAGRLDVLTERTWSRTSDSHLAAYEFAAAARGRSG